MRKFALLLGLAALPAQAADLTITVSNLRSENGFIRAGLFSLETTWLDGDRAQKTATVPAVRPVTTLRFEGLAPGRYAVALFHDENANGTHDRNLLGIPLEGFGFTRNPTILLSAPSFADCAVEVPEAGTQEEVRIKY